MKKALIFLIVTLVPFISQAQSRTGNGLTDAEKLAILSGAAQACQADQDKLINYEVIVSRILVNPTTSEQEETAVLTAYARKKFQVFNEQKSAPEMDCDEVLRRFDNLEIFKSVVYQDGTIKLPDGKVIKPVRPIVVENVDTPTSDNKKTKPASQKPNTPVVAEKKSATPAKKSATPSESAKKSAKPAGKSPLKPFHPKTIVNSAAH